MEKIIIKHLDSQYMFTLSTIHSYKVIDRHTHEKIFIKTLLIDLQTIFGINSEELSDIWDIWCEKKIVELNNRITEIRYELYELTGVDDFNMSRDDINNALLYGNPFQLPNDQ